MPRRATRHWVQLGLQVALVLAAALGLQVVADRTNRRLDLTVGRDLSVSQVTRKVLAEVAGPMRITVFHARGQRGRYAGLLARLRAVAPVLETELLDLDRYPERARSLGVTQYGRAAIEYEGRRTNALADSESLLMGGVLRVLRGHERRVALTVGHGERVPGGDADGVRRLVAALEIENYRTQPLRLAAEDVPTGTDVLVVAGPRLDFAPETAARVLRYLRGGGGVLVLLEPLPVPNLGRMLDTLGVRLRPDFVVDHERRILATDGLAAVVEFFRRGNPISEAADVPIETGVVLPSARSIDLTGASPPDVDLTVVARTGSTAWAMRDPARARRGETPTVAAGDEKGPVPVMVMGTAGAGRLVVVGDVDFLSDAYFDLLGNGHLALNAIAWLAREDSLTGGRQREMPEVPRPLSPLVVTEATARRLFLTAVVGEPLVVLVIGTVAVWRRRRRG